MSNPIKPTFKTEWFSLALIILTAIAAVYFWQKLPMPVPIHWNLAGEVDGYGSPHMAAVILPLMTLFIYLLFLVLPYLDPKKEQYANFAATYHHFKNLMIAFIFVFYLLTGVNGLGYKINMGVWAPLLIGLLFVILGCLLKKVQSNWFIGIRTPWTLSSETVWNKTHQMSGRVFILAGIFMGLTALVPGVWKLIGFIIAIGLLVAALPIYSYFLYAREKKTQSKM